jgi:adenylate cyclase
MTIDAVARLKIKTIISISTAGIIIPIVYANLVFGFGLSITIEAAIIGLLITSVSSTVEIFFFSDYFREKKFVFVVLVRSLFYLLLISSSILLVLIFYESARHDVNVLSAIRSSYLINFLKGDFISILLFSIAASFIINFIRQISSMLGWKVLMNVMLGKYKHPVAALRVFMFLDLKSSTGIAEKLGGRKYSAFLQDFFADITSPILETKGEVYQYVGDEVVITWQVDKNKLNSLPLDCYFLIIDKINQRKDYYLEEYGIVPDFKAGIHAGKAVTTEIGELQKEIVFHGDVLNTASRLRSECSRLNKQNLVSSALLAVVDMKDKYKYERLGFQKLRGKSVSTELFTISKMQD